MICPAQNDQKRRDPDIGKDFIHDYFLQPGIVPLTLIATYTTIVLCFISTVIVLNLRQI